MAGRQPELTRDLRAAAVFNILLTMATDALTRALRQALTKNPASRRALAEAAGVDHTLIAHVLAGRKRATPALVRRLAAALAQWEQDCASGAAILRRALTRKGD